MPIYLSAPDTLSMNAADRTELYRLCDHLRSIDERMELSSEQREALEKSGLALHRVFMAGSRAEIENSHAMIDQPPLDSERAHLGWLGIDPNIHQT